MSDNVLPDQTQAALQELTKLVHHLGKELASYRKRALTAESRLKAIDELAAQGGPSLERSFEIERENTQLHERLDKARDRTQAMVDRVRFLRQQGGDKHEA